MKYPTIQMSKRDYCIMMLHQAKVRVHENPEDFLSRAAVTHYTAMVQKLSDDDTATVTVVADDPSV